MDVAELVVQPRAVGRFVTVVPPGAYKLRSVSAIGHHGTTLAGAQQLGGMEGQGREISTPTEETIDHREAEAMRTVLDYRDPQPAQARHIGGGPPRVPRA